jgi:NAD(P)-dependent dehydrogenase (short-subunit alcohol dehydrogenase family)
VRTIIVTGANSGIGKAAALQLAQAGHHVVAVCRDEAKGRAAVEEIRAAAPGAQVDLVLGDLSTVASTRELAERLLAACPRIHVLVNNAGVWMTQRKLNADGLELTFMVNHLAPFMLTLLLLERLKASAPARIVNVNAGLYANGEVDLDNLPAGENFNRFKTYMHSKLCNVYFTTELARRLEGSGVTVNALHPGVIRTNLGDSRGPLGLVLRVVKRLWKSPEKGAKPVVRLAIGEDVEGVSGRYYNEFEEIPVADNAKDPETSEKLWNLSLDLCGVAETVQGKQS